MRLHLILLLIITSLTSASGQELKYTVCENCWSPDSLGNHRAVIKVPSAGKMASITIPWRRRDANVENKIILISDGNGKLISNLRRGKISREAGELFFEPISGPGTYYVYYFKYFVKGRSNYPTIVYPEFKETAAQDWVKSTAG